MAAHVRRFTGVGLVALLALAGCGTTSGGASGRSSSAAAAPSAVATTDPAAAASVQEGVDVYLKLLDTFVAASNAGAADAPDLPKYASGQALLTVKTILTTYRSQGVRTQGNPKIGKPVVTAYSPASAPTSAKLTGCFDNSDWPFVKADGKPVDNLGPQQQAQGPSAVNATLAKAAEGWRVTELVIEGACPA